MPMRVFVKFDAGVLYKDSPETFDTAVVEFVSTFSKTSSPS